MKKASTTYLEAEQTTISVTVWVQKRIIHIFRVELKKKKTFLHLKGKEMFFFCKSYLISSRRMAAVLSCRLRSGMVKTQQSPRLVKQSKSTSECFTLVSAFRHEKVPKAIRRTRAPSCAVNLYFPYGFSDGSVKILNCSSEAIMTRCACVMSGSGAMAFSTSRGSGSGLFEPSRTAIEMTGARCFSWISLASWQVTESVDRFCADGTPIVNTYTVPLFVPAHRVGVVFCTGIM